LDQTSKETTVTRIIQGVLDFQRRIFGRKKELFQKLGEGQRPLALFITCSDSRVDPLLLTQTEPGELFILRNAGNIVPPAGAEANGEEATIEYAVAALGIRDIILCGHAKCGAMHGIMAPQALEKLPRVGAWLSYARGVPAEVEKAGTGLSEEKKVELAIEKNVLLQLDNLRTHAAVRDALAARTLRLHGWVYDFVNGQVNAYNPVTGQFGALTGSPRKSMLEGAPPEKEAHTGRHTIM
jgi:carbonic anhydrase